MIKNIFSVLLISFAIFQTAAYADYFCDFENGANEWIRTPSTPADNASVEVVSDPENTDNSVLLISGNSGEASAAVFFDKLDGLIEVSYRLRLDDMHSDVLYFGSTDVLSPMIHNEYFIFSGVYSSKIAKPDTWFDVRYVIDTGLLKYSAYVNSNALVTNKSIANKAILGIGKFSSTAYNAKVYIDDLSVKKIGESQGDSGIWFYSSSYRVDYTNNIIGNFRHRTKVSEVLDCINTASGIEKYITTDKEYVENGDVLVLKRTSDGETKEYTLTVRTESMTKLHDRIYESDEYPISFRKLFSIFN